MSLTVMTRAPLLQVRKKLTVHFNFRTPRSSAAQEVTSSCTGGTGPAFYVSPVKAHPIEDFIAENHEDLR